MRRTLGVALGLALVIEACSSGGDDPASESCTPPNEQSECDPFSDCGCASGTVCRWDTTVATCFPAATSVGTTGAACDNPAQCETGFGCELFRSSACQPICRSSADCPGEAGCYLTGAIGYCSSACDPWNPAVVCGANARCTIQFGSPDGWTFCSPGLGSAAVGEICGSTADCGPGLDCIESECRAYCRDGGSDCPLEYPSCVPLNVDGNAWAVCEVAS